MKAEEIVSRAEIPKKLIEHLSSEDAEEFVEIQLRSAGFNLDKPMAVRYSCTSRGNVYLQTKGQLL